MLCSLLLQKDQHQSVIMPSKFNFFSFKEQGNYFGLKMNLSFCNLIYLKLLPLFLVLSEHCLNFTYTVFLTFSEQSERQLNRSKNSLASSLSWWLSFSLGDVTGRSGAPYEIWNRMGTSLTAMSQSISEDDRTKDPSLLHWHLCS